MQSPEPILDIVRMLSLITSFNIGVRQTARLWRGIYSDPCQQCRGTGKTICPHCRGTKKLSRLPNTDANKEYYLDLPVLEDTTYSYKCTFCGDYSYFDYDFEGKEDPRDIQSREYDKDCRNALELIKSAFKNQLVLDYRRKPLAGTMNCEQCKGYAVIWRHTPNVRRFLNLDPPWYVQIAQKAGYGRSRPQAPEFCCTEYPIVRQPSPGKDGLLEYLKFRYPQDMELDKKRAEVKQKVIKEHMDQSGAASMRDFVLPYIEGGDGEEEDQIA